MFQVDMRLETSVRGIRLYKLEDSLCCDGRDL